MITENVMAEAGKRVKRVLSEELTKRETEFVLDRRTPAGMSRDQRRTDSKGTIQNPG